MIDEKELTDISAVVELTKWVKDGHVVPYFLWCLRDFMLDIEGYASSDDYLENVLSTKDLEQSDEKYRIRKTLNEFFKERNCLFFVRPVNDEGRLRVIETLKPAELRPQFTESLDRFKSIIFSHLKPKRVGERILNGATFIKLIKDVLGAFNSKKVPEITSSVERIFENERREVVEGTKSFLDQFVRDHIESEGLARAGVEALWKRLSELSIQKQNAELPGEVFGDLLNYFYGRLESEKGSKGQRFLREIELFVEDLLNEPDFALEPAVAKLKGYLNEKGIMEREVTLQFAVDKLVNKLFRKAAVVSADQQRHFKYELEEKEKDIEAEKEKKKLVNKLLAEQKTTIAEYQTKIQTLELALKSKTGEIADLRRADNSEQALLNQLALNRERIEKLENDLRLANERAVGATNLKDLKASVLLGNLGDNAQLLSADSEELRDFLEYLKDEMLKENSELRAKLELTQEEVDRLKCNGLDTAEKEEMIVELRAKVEKLEKAKGNNQFEAEFARVAFENAQLKANQEYYLNVVREVLKVTKKQKHQLKNAIGLLNEADGQQIINMLKEFKLTY